MKKALRIVIALVFLLPSLPVFWLTYTVLGIIPVIAVICSIYNLVLLLMGMREKMELEVYEFTAFGLLSPFVFWLAFIQKDEKTLQSMGLLSDFN